MIEHITETPVASVDFEQLVRETASIAGLDHISTGDGVITAWLTDESAYTDVEDAISSHVPGSKRVKIWRYIERRPGMSRLDPAFDVDYITQLTQRLHPTNSIVVDGEIRRIEYYASAQPPNAYGVVEYSDLIVSEDFSYTRDGAGFARARLQTITWYCEDGDPHQETKQRLKFYENDESLREGQRRRRNITDTLSMVVTGWLVATQTQHNSVQDRIDMGREFMRHHKTSFDMYADASSSQILYDVRDDEESAHSWLDSDISAGVTVRAKILDDLNIWNLTL